MKNRTTAAALATLLLSSCVLYYPTGAMEADTAINNVVTTPACASQAECNAKWAAARKWIAHRIERPLVDSRDDHLETEAPFPGSRSLSARVQKVKMPDGSFRIVANVWCSSPLQCEPLEVYSIANFNHDVNEAWPESPPK